MWQLSRGLLAVTNFELGITRSGKLKGIQDLNIRAGATVVDFSPAMRALIRDDTFVSGMFCLTVRADVPVNCFRHLCYTPYIF